MEMLSEGILSAFDSVSMHKSETLLLKLNLFISSEYEALLMLSTILIVLLSSFVVCSSSILIHLERRCESDFSHCSTNSMQLSSLLEHVKHIVEGSPSLG